MRRVAGGGVGASVMGSPFAGTRDPARLRSGAGARASAGCSRSVPALVRGRHGVLAVWTDSPTTRGARTGRPTTADGPTGPGPGSSGCCGASSSSWRCWWSASRSGCWTAADDAPPGDVVGSSASSPAHPRPHPVPAETDLCRTRVARVGSRCCEATRVRHRSENAEPGGHEERSCCPSADEVDICPGHECPAIRPPRAGPATAPLAHGAPGGRPAPGRPAEGSARSTSASAAPRWCAPTGRRP